MSKWQEFQPTYSAYRPRKWYQFWKSRLVEVPGPKMEYKVDGNTVHYRSKSK